ncbi:hypothetical protein SETIT_9G536700v2 [Setaria italica]|uniref:Uncharacterized protein n=2 Tax=Setaria italica TaxID=4555 RepID=A0A368SVR3_SETIT|nr:hypothetical protein SETIT_9G536700v2 [Setaria italica]
MTTKSVPKSPSPNHRHQFVLKLQATARCAGTSRAWRGSHARGGIRRVTSAARVGYLLKPGMGERHALARASDAACSCRAMAPAIGTQAGPARGGGLREQAVGSRRSNWIRSRI